jgi:SAM-dependent methyltransferase
MYSDLWGKALLNYYHGNRRDPLILHTSFGDPELVPLEVFFRGHERFSDLEAFACELCQGKVLDVGAGTGCHARWLQQAGHQVTALEKSPGACQVMRLGGVEQVMEEDIYQFKATGFETVLMMMNGLGLAGTLVNLANLLSTVCSLLVPGGQIIAVSSDISYLYEGQVIPEDKYFGELTYSYEYQGKKDPTFPWLFVDFEHLRGVAEKMNLQVQLVFEEEQQYLARITR